MKSRGFMALKGKTIKNIRVSAVNEVQILCEDGTLFFLETELGALRVPTCNLVKQKGRHLGLPKIEKVQGPAWPFDDPSSPVHVSPPEKAQLPPAQAWPFPGRRRDDPPSRPADWSPWWR